MNKRKNQQLNIRNKLFAAIAMLLVSSIMMVSTTYAWFTLSTAPEVQGITTTVGANGALEIALSPFNGDPNGITSDVEDGAATKSWTTKNLTWGNLLNLEDESYGLGQIKLLPARVNMNVSGNTRTLNGSALSIPVYGYDGRISGMNSSSVSAGALNDATEAEGFEVDAGYGIRALGTSSSASPEALNFRNALSNLNTERGNANTAATNALDTYGGTLAAIAIQHAGVEGTDGTDYSKYVKDLNAMMAMLSTVSADLEDALYYAVMAIGLTENGKNVNVTIGEESLSLYEAAKTAMEQNLNFADNVWAKAKDATVATTEQGTAITLAQAFPLLDDAVTRWEETSTDIGAATSAVNQLPTDGTNVNWSSISNALSKLMNTSAVTVNGYELSEVRANIGALMGGVVLELNDGSGVFAHIAAMTGTVTSGVTLPAGTEVGGFNLGGSDITITTTSTPEAGPILSQVRTTINAVGVGAGGNVVEVIDTTYGYGIDLMFRTNAADSMLMLQTDAAQRIYGDSENAATMGAGSSMTFPATDINVNSVLGVMDGLRIVFADTAGDSPRVYGIAKLDLGTLTTTNANGDTVNLYAHAVVNNVTASTAGITPKVEVLTGAAGGAEFSFKISGLDEEETTKNPTFYVYYDVEGDETTEEVTTGEGEDAVTKTQVTDINLKEINVNGNGTYTIPAADVTGDIVIYLVDAEHTDKVNPPAAGITPAYTYMMPAGVTNANMTAKMYMYNYETESGAAIEWKDRLATQSIMPLGQNQVHRLTAWVYLDGDAVDNADVGNNPDGIFVTGAMNLQFASSATLVPMENTELRKVSYNVSFTNNATANITIEGEEFAFADKDYSFTLNGLTNEVVTIKIGGVDYTATNNAGTYTIPAADVKGTIQIVVTDAPAQNP